MEYTIHLGEDTLNELDKIVNGGGSEGGIQVEPLEVTENGEYTAPEGKAYSPVSVNVEGGGGESDFETITVTNKTGNTIYLEGITTAGKIETEIQNDASAQIVAEKFTYEGDVNLAAQFMICAASLIPEGTFTPLAVEIGMESAGLIDVVCALVNTSTPPVNCFYYVFCEENANIIIKATQE